MYLNERDHNNILAMIKFWREVLEHSKVPPESHPRVMGMFEIYPPYTIPELDALIAHYTKENNGRAKAKKFPRG